MALEQYEFLVPLLIFFPVDESIDPANLICQRLPRLRVNHIHETEGTPHVVIQGDQLVGFIVGKSEVF